MHLSPDEVIYWQYGFFKLNNTILTTWVLMIGMALGAWLITRNLSSGIRASRKALLLEIVVTGIKAQIEAAGLQLPERHIGFLGSLFLFIALSNFCTIFPVYEPPTGSLSTTAALAICAFVAVPAFGISENGLRGFLRSYFEPTFLMLPFNLISELSRTLALAIRLFGNMMSGAMIIGILLSIAPFLFPVVMSLLGLLTGLVQAYIFSMLATVYMAAASRVHESAQDNPIH